LVKNVKLSKKEENSEKMDNFVKKCRKLENLEKNGKFSKKLKHLEKKWKKLIKFGKNGEN